MHCNCAGRFAEWDAAPGAADRPAATEINEVAVTAQRRKQLLTDVGMTVSRSTGSFCSIGAR